MIFSNCKDNNILYFYAMKKVPNIALGRVSAEEFLTMARRPVVVVLDNLRSLNNVGSFFRTCDAFAAQAIYICGITPTPPHRDIHKTALGAELTMPWKYFPQTLDAIEELKGEEFTIVAIEQVEGATPLQDFRPRPGEKYALIFGNEVFGVAQEVVDRCDMAIEIPQQGTKHSLNVAVAGGVVLWQVAKS